MDYEFHKLSYWRLHFGTDVLMSCWFLLISTIFFVLVPINGFIEDSSRSLVDTVYYSCLLASGVLYLFGNVMFLSVSYPDAMESLLVSTMQTDIEKLSFLERYFTGNNILAMTWFFALATLPLAVYYVWAVCAGEISGAYGTIAIIAIAISFASLLFWVIACFPENMIKNEGRGSKFFIEFMERYNLFCGLESFWRAHLTGDFLVGSWILFILALFSLPSSLVYFFMDPGNFDAYMILLSSIFFVLGAALLVHASYPGNFTSDLSWQILTCTHDGKSQLFVGLAQSSDETQPLTQSIPSKEDPYVPSSSISTVDKR